MMDKFMDKILESAASTYAPHLKEVARGRKAKLEEIRAKVRTNPDEVEDWLDKEIEKLGSVDIKEMMKNATAGI